MSARHHASLLAQLPVQEDTRAASTNKKNKTASIITKGRMPKACGHLHV